MTVNCCVAQLGLEQPSYYFYMNQSGTYLVDDVDDKKDFEETMVGVVLKHS